MLVSPPAQRSLGQGKRTAATSATTSRKSGDVPRTSDTSGYDKMADVLCSESDRKQFAASVINESALSAGEKSGKCANLALPNRMQSATGVTKRAETVKTRVNREQQNMTATGQLQQQQQQQKQQQSKKVSDSKMSKNKSASIMALSSQGPGPVGSHVGAGMCPVVLGASAGPVVGSGIGTSGSGGGGVGIANATAGKSNNASRVSIEMKKTLPSKVKNVSLQASIAAVTGVTTTKIPIPKSHQKKDLKSVSAAPHLDMAGVNSVLEPGQKQEQQQQQQQDIDDGPSAKKKRCSDRYDSSESSDSGVATLSCTDSSTASSDASDPGSPYSPVSLGEDANQSSTKANMPPQILSSITQQDHRVQTHQSHQQTSTSNHQTAQHQQPPKQHQWPWNVSSNNNNTLSTRFNNTCSNNNIIVNAGVKCSNNSSVNSVLSGNGNANTKSKRISSANHSDINGTAKKARSSAGTVDRMHTHAGLTAGASKRLKVQQEESPAQKKITGYFKSQMKPLKVPTKSDLNTLVSKTTSTDAQSATAALDKYFNALAAKTVTSSMPVGTKEVKDQTQRKLIAIKKDFIDLPPLAQTKSMPPSLKKFERKPAQVAQVAPNPRKSSATAQVKSPKKHVAIAPRTAEPIKTQAQIPLSTTAFQIDQTKISQPTVLLTAIRIPPQSNAQVQQQMSTSTSLPQQTNVKAPPLTPTKLGPMLQIPVVPNLVQIPNLLATTNGTNLVMNNGQLTRVGNGGQYFLNGTVLKLQQISNGHPANSNNGNGVLTMDSSSLQGNILVKQSPTISPSMPIIATSTQAKGTALSSQQPIVAQASINGNGCHPAYLANQRIPTQSVLMATSSGWYVLNQSTTDVISNNIAHQTTLATAMMCKPTRAAVTSITNNVSLPVPPLATLSSKVDTTPTLGPKNLGASTITTSTTIPAEQKTKTLISDAEPIEPDKPLTVECPPLEPLKEISIPPLTSNGILESLKNKFFPPKSPSCPAIFTTEDLGEKDTRAPVATAKCAISPILSQPKTIRFPVPSGCEAGYRFGPKGTKRPDGVCYWDKCIEKYDTNSKLLDHLQTQHVNSQTGPFSCLWSGCKVRGRESCSRRWLERHVLSHGGTKPFKCIVDGCGLRLGSQLALQKHVNGHFNATESKDNQNKRASDPPVPKLLRKNGKKLRYRRQPFSARMFDFFDAGIMEGLQHRLLVTGSLVNSSKGSIAFTGRSMARRKTSSGITELYVKWSPSEIIPDEWIPESKNALSKTVTIQSMQYHERLALNKYLKSTSQNVDVNGKTVPKQQFSASAATTAVSSLFNCNSSSIVDSKPAAAAVSNGRKHSRKPPKKNDIEPS